MVCARADYKVEQTLNEGQNLLDQLALLIKNAFGQDVSPDNRRHVIHVQQMMESLQDRKLKCDDLAEVRRLKLTQIMQLRKCEGEADQVRLFPCHCIGCFTRKYRRRPASRSNMSKFRFPLAVLSSIKMIKYI